MLKPQKEGGGNGIFDEQVREKLLEALAGSEKDELRSYLIMERIRPPIIENNMLIDGQVQKVDSLSEFGFYSAVFTQNGRQDFVGSLNES